MARGRRERPGASSRLRWVLAAVLVPAALLTVVGLVLLRPTGDVRTLPGGLGPQSGLLAATLVTRTVVPCPGSDATPQVAGQTTPSSQSSCVHATLRLHAGPDKGRTIPLDVVSTPQMPFPRGGVVELSRQDSGDGTFSYAFADVQRGGPVLLLGVLFALAVLVVGRWTGLRALVGLGLSLTVVVAFVLPALLRSENAVLVALVGSSAVMFVALYLAHGFNVRTSVAVVATLTSLLLIVGLSDLWVAISHLTGLGDDNVDLLTTTVNGIDPRGLLLAGIVIGSLGILDDVTVTQVSAVWELHQARPDASRVELYRSGLRIGRDHIASTVNTLVLAYAGAALPLLVVFTLSRVALTGVVTSEVVTQEVVRTLVGSLGLVAAVPVSTLLAALVIAREPVDPDAPPLHVHHH